MMIRVFCNPGADPPFLDFVNDLVFYASDGDGDLHVHLYTENWVRTAGHKVAEGGWTQVAEMVPAEDRLASRWAKGQNALADDPDKVPGKV